MSDLLLDDVQSELYRVFTEDGRVPVYDLAPEGADLPYVSFGPSEARPILTLRDLLGYDVDLTLHVWSGEGGQLDAKRLCETVNQVLDAATVVLQGFTVTLFHLVSVDVDHRPSVRQPSVQARLRYRLRARIA